MEIAPREARASVVDKVAIEAEGIFATTRGVSADLDALYLSVLELIKGAVGYGFDEGIKQRGRSPCR